MKYSLIFFSCVFNLALLAQTTSSRKHFTHQKQAVVNFNNITQDFAPIMMVKEKPKQAPKTPEDYHYPPAIPNTNKKVSIILPSLSLGASNFANPWDGSTPNDNDIAISDSGIVVSVVNSTIWIKNTKTNVVSPIKSLSAFTAPVNNYHQESDPKILYDPKTDRFVFMCFTGFVDTTSKLIVGFSQTNDPTGNWNLYTLPGNPLNNHLWSDYPMLAFTDKELFLSINLLYNDSSWQTGFVETIVWQMKKDSGYAGLPLGSYLHHDIKYNGKFIRNLCPAKGGSKLYSPNMYFVSNRNLALQNDSVFLVEITDTIGAPTQTVNITALKSNQSYYFPPNGRQTAPTQSLATNDARNLGAYYENGKIHYVHNTKNPANNLVSVYYGVIDNVQSVTPSVMGYIIPNDTVDFGFPNISYAGNSPTDHTSIINFNHTSNKILPGCSAIRADELGNFSPVLRIINGSRGINILTENLERWGDYSGSQRKYNTAGEVWVSGYYGYKYNNFNPATHAAWVAQIGTTPISVSVNEKQTNETTTLLFPNPAQDNFSVDIHLDKPEYLTMQLFDAQGKLVHVLLKDWAKGKENRFQFSLKDIAIGVYFLKITGNFGTSISKKIIKN